MAIAHIRRRPDVRTSYRHAKWWEVEMRRSSSMALTLVEFARDLGVAPSRSLSGTGVRLAELEDPDSEADSEDELTIARNIVRELGSRPCLGVEAGQRVHATTYGLLGLGLLSSATVGAALSFAGRNSALCMTLTDLSLGQRRWAHIAQFDDRRLPADVQRFLFERDVTIYSNFFTDCVSRDIRPVRITCRLPSPSPDVVDRYAKVFGVRPEFGAPTNQVMVSARTLALPMPQAHQPTARLAQRLCEDLIRRRQTADGLVGRVDTALRRAKGRVGQQEIAKSLAMSTRNLRKQLLAEGTAYRQVALKVSMELAQDMLAGGDSVQVTTERLGYSDPTAFARAFKRWTGLSPAAYARSVRPSTTTDAGPGR
jgi:AraC-like DNA-binding protein